MRKALDPENLRPGILLADAVGLGKTLEIGMILSELVRRGRGERILIVTPRHVLEQMQHEMWSRFALPFVRLDSPASSGSGRSCPATRNPFTLLQARHHLDRHAQERPVPGHLRKQHWDAVVIDESHNVTNTAHAEQPARPACSRRNTEALILASATPHNGQAESFAELIRLLDPTAVPPGRRRSIEDEVRRLVIRRHRHSPEVASVVGADWAEREEPQNGSCPPPPRRTRSPANSTTSGCTRTGGTPTRAARVALFPWTLAKAFLSSPAALLEIDHGAARAGSASTARPPTEREIEALRAARRSSPTQGATTAARPSTPGWSSYLQEIGVGAGLPRCGRWSSPSGSPR